MKYIQILLIIFLWKEPNYGINNIDIFIQKLTKIRIDYYKDRTNLPNRNTITQLYQEIQNHTNLQEQARLIPYWGLIASELLLYHHSKDFGISSNYLRDIYKKYYYLTIKSHSSSLLQQFGEFTLLMIQIDPAYKQKYLSDAQEYFVKALRCDKNNTLAKLGLGKWWAYQVINTKHMEFNHSFANALKYLDSKLLFDNTEIGNTIALFQLYETRSMLFMKNLHTAESYQDLIQAQQLFPHAAITKMLEQCYAQHIIKWI